MVDDPRDVVEEEAGVDGVQHGPGARHTEVQLHVAVPTEAATTTAYQQHTHTERNREATYQEHTHQVSCCSTPPPNKQDDAGPSQGGTHPTVCVSG